MSSYYIDTSFGTLSLDNNELDPSFYSTFNNMHMHNALEISLFKSGKGVYAVDNKLYDMQAGDIFLFNNKEQHCICNVAPEEPAVNMVIHFDPSFIYFSPNDYFDYRFLKIFFDRTDNFQNRLERSNPYTIEIAQLLLEIEEEFVRKESDFELAVKVKLLGIFVLLTRHFGYTHNEKHTYTAHKPALVMIQTVIEYIHANYSKDLNLEMLANEVNLSSAYLSTLFSKYNGISLWTYLCKTRVGHALEELKSSDKTILEIATSCGFNNPSNFNRIFKKITGVTPSEYRKNIK